MIDVIFTYLLVIAFGLGQFLLGLFFIWKLRERGDH